MRADEPLPGDAKGWLLAQFERYVAQPPAWAAQPSSASLLVAYGDLLRAQRQADAASEVAARQKLAAEVRDRYRAAVAARVTTALVTPAPFAERLVHFWANHFAVSIEKPSIGSIAGAFEAEAIRPNVFGSFETMLVAVERHPAMLIYLDQVRSIGPDSVAARRAAAADPERQRGLNENLAREILELHTIGVRSGYSQDDVTEFARALTGWSVGGAAGPYSTRPGIEPGRFVFVPALHEPGARNVLGERYEAAAKGRRSPSCAARGRAGDGAPHRDQAGAPLRRRCAAAGAGRSARERLPAQRRRPADGLPRADRFARSVAARAGQVQDAVGVDAVGACAASAGATCAARSSRRCWRSSASRRGGRARRPASTTSRRAGPRPTR